MKYMITCMYIMNYFIMYEREKEREGEGERERIHVRDDHDKLHDYSRQIV